MVVCNIWVIFPVKKAPFLKAASSLFSFHFSFCLPEGIDDRPSPAHHKSCQFRKYMEQEEYPDGDQQGDAEAGIGEENSHQPEQGAEQIDDQNRLPVAVAGLYQLIMEVAIICSHDAFFIIGPPHHRDNRVENRHGQDDDRDNEAEKGDVLEQSQHGYHCNHIAKEIGTRVPHIYLGRIEIVVQETDIGPYQCDAEKGDDHLRIYDGHDKNADKRYCCHPCCKTIESVNQIDGIGDGDNPDHRDEDTEKAKLHYPYGRNGNPFDNQPRKYEQGCSCQLPGQLQEWLYRILVINRSRQNDHD